MVIYRSGRSPNHLLAGLSKRLYDKLLPHLDEVELLSGQVLYEPGVEMTHVYFPLDCLVSLLASVDLGRSMEVGMVGKEGMLGVPLILGAKTSAVKALVQGNGIAVRMTAARFQLEVKAEAALRTAALRYTNGLMSQFAQTAACNRFHTTGGRLARWLLTAGDGLQASSFFLTQSFMAQMLGVRRVSITDAASAMEKAGLIYYSRGRIRIRDRIKLQEAACSCYQVIEEIKNRTP